MPQPLPPMLSEEFELQVTLAAMKVVCNLSSGTAEVLIQWTDLSKLESSWESMETMMHPFPSFHLEDKVTLFGGRIVRPLISKHYQRINQK